VALDASTSISREDEEALDAARGRPAVVVLNKSDLKPFIFRADVSVRLPHAEVVCASMVTGAGLADMEMALARVVLDGKMAPQDVTVSRARHVASLEAARDTLEAVVNTLREGWPLDLAAQDLQTAARHLGEIGGQTASDKVIEEIFARFCVGK
jgi:tRNA modification GTPase